MMRMARRRNFSTLCSGNRKFGEINAFGKKRPIAVHRIRKGVGKYAVDFQSSQKRRESASTIQQRDLSEDIAARLPGIPDGGMSLYIKVSLARHRLH